jgi:hypothetical protein
VSWIVSFKSYLKVDAPFFRNPHSQNKDSVIGLSIQALTHKELFLQLSRGEENMGLAVKYMQYS